MSRDKENTITISIFRHSSLLPHSEHPIQPILSLLYSIIVSSTLSADVVQLVAVVWTLSQQSAFSLFDRPVTR